MAHIGLTPQSVNTIGGYQAQGRAKDQWPALEADADAVADAGAFAVVLEAMAEPLAAKITTQVAIPTIGIGASAKCDGQILVMEDMLGFADHVPRFVKRYATIGKDIEAAIRAYADDVRTRAFPPLEHTYALRDD